MATFATNPPESRDNHDFYEFIAMRLATTPTGEQLYIRLGAVKMSAMFAVPGDQVLRTRIVEAGLAGGLLECDTDTFLSRLQMIIRETTIV